MRTVIAAIESVTQDIRYGVRLLWQTPWFTGVAVASLAIGLGGAIALFTVSNALLFRPLPGRGTADLYSLYTSSRSGGRYGPTSFADFESFVAASPRLFTAACATTGARGNLTLDSPAAAPAPRSIACSTPPDAFRVSTPSPPRRSCR